MALVFFFLHVFNFIHPFIQVIQMHHKARLVKVGTLSADDKKKFGLVGVPDSEEVAIVEPSEPDAEPDAEPSEPPSLAEEPTAEAQ